MFQNSHRTLVITHTEYVAIDVTVPAARLFFYYRQTPNISRTLVGYKLVDHSDAVGASPVGASPTTSSFST